MAKNKKIKEEENTLEEQLLNELIMNKTGKAVTYAEMNKVINELRGKLIQKLLDKEFENHMQYEKGSHEEKETTNRRNGKGSKKTIRTPEGNFEVEMPRDREGTFEPVTVPKRKRLIDDIAEHVTLLYSKGNSIRDIKDILEKMYGTKLNEQFISDATKMVNEEVNEWKQRPLKEIYSIIYMDCLYTDVRNERSVSENKAVYVALGIDIKGSKEIIGFWIGDSEASSFWYGILDEIKERGVKDILFLCTDGVAGFKEILNESFPKTIHQRCIVHITRNMCKCVSNKQREELCKDLKGIYKVKNYEEAKENSKVFREKWRDNILLMRKFNEYEESMLELYTYSENIRKLIYTTNAIESVNSCLRKVTNGKGCFINNTALEKVLYLRIKDLEEKWKRMTRSNWPIILNELIILFGERVEKYIEL